MSQKYLDEAFGLAVGKKLKSVRSLTEQEMEALEFDPMEWENAVLLDFGKVGIVLTQDPEGNGPGFGELVELA